jgi:lipopolysaccharide transport system ATP-binding protein
MPGTIISVENLSKSYRLGVIGTGTFRGDLQRWWAQARGLPDPHSKIGESDYNNREGDTIWALKDINFQVSQGEALGIIGRNGAGKSTLLKILSRVTAPTTGVVKVRGRIASLLEVGTGFHPELTGRENIYLNGTILGMKKAEIDRKFDEIVDFAGEEQFIDTPVKRYSSGMYVRLAFAVAAHLEPEILIVDEVLAVGDAEFQNKCLGKMSAVAHGGRTVLFVSHNMVAISALCSRTLWLDGGALAMAGNTVDVVNSYLSGFYPKARSLTLDNVQHYGNGNARFVGLTITAIDKNGKPKTVFSTGSDLAIDVKIKAINKVVGANVAIIIYDTNSYRLIDANTALKDQFVSLAPDDEISVHFKLQEVLLKPGKYLVGLWMGRPNIEDIDGIMYADTLLVETDPESIQHSQVFPGIYQCKYQIRINDPI